MAFKGTIVIDTEGCKSVESVLPDVHRNVLRLEKKRTKKDIIT